jgi:diguanylate cyclase (GGDEF)-like protein
MKYFAYSLYIFALVIQIATVFQCFATLKHIGKLRIGWMMLAIAFTLIFIHTFISLANLRWESFDHILDALFSVVVAAFFFAGIFSIRQVMDFQVKKNTELEQLNQYDNLTHALSRAEIMKRLETEVVRSKQFHQPLAVIEIDIDHFKPINDTYGHQVGDEILKSLTQSCLSVLRKNDSFGRIGGEEFLIILPEADAVNALEAAERLRMCVASVRHITSAPCEIRITISLGIVNFVPLASDQSDINITISDLLKHADQAMYQAKAAGRNRVVLWK